MRALDLAQSRGAQYADVRVVNHRDRKHLGEGWDCRRAELIRNGGCGCASTGQWMPGALPPAAI